MILSASTFYMLAKHKRRVELKTSAYSEEIKTLIADVEQRISDTTNYRNKTSSIQAQIEYLRAIDKDKWREVAYIQLIPLLS
jgi:hypothetical protein